MNYARSYRATWESSLWKAALWSVWVLVLTPWFCVAQLDDTWTVSINGQTARVRADGTFFIPNISAPDRFGPGGPGTAPDFFSDNCLRVIGSSTVNGVTRWVTSEPFVFQEVCPGGASTCSPRLRRPTTFLIGDLTISESPPSIPVGLDLGVAAGQPGTLTMLGQTTQLQVLATMSDGSIRDLTAETDCVEYRVAFNTSNLQIGRVNSAGLVTAVKAGSAFITAASAGVTSVMRLVVSPGDPLTTLDGFVQDEGGAPLGNVTIQVLGQPNTGVTDSNGHFEIPGVATAQGNIVIAAQGYGGTSSVVPPVPGALTDMGLTTLTAPDSQGVEFVVAFQKNLNNTNVELSLLISGNQATAGEVEIPGIGFNTTFAVTPGLVTRVPLPPGALVTESDTVVARGIRVTAQRSITVYGLNHKPQSTDALTVLPVDALGTVYRPMCHLDRGTDRRSQFAVVATEDNTVVMITPRAATPGHPINTPYSIPLNRLDVYQLLTNTSNSDLTGSLISSDRPVAVFSGHSCANVPTNAFGCDHLCEQMPPVDAWGNHVITLPLATRINGDTFRILANEDDTCVAVDGQTPSVATLAAGQFAQFVLDGANEITATHPILVAQFSNGTSWDAVTGDPFMTLMLPSSQFLRDYTIATPQTGFGSNFVNIISPTDAANAGLVLVDGNPIPPSEFLSIANTGFSGTAWPITVGSHRILSEHPIGVYAYGFAPQDSYGYFGGLALDDAPDPTAPPVDCNGNGVHDACDIARSVSTDCDGSAIPDECESPDCNGNITPDVCDLVAGTSNDCNTNSTPDECDIAVGFSPDCNGNNIPDECEPDCNGNGVADSCDIIDQTSDDCNDNGVPDECDLRTGSRVVASDLCIYAPMICRGTVQTGTTVGATNDGATSCAFFDSFPDVWYRYRPASEGEVTISLCGSTFDTILSVHVSCVNAELNEVACNDNFCGSTSRVTFLAEAAVEYLIRITGDFDSGDFILSFLSAPESMPGSCDCNANLTPDDCDISNGTSEDCNANGFPDECETDCNGNGVPDLCDFVGGTSTDCDQNNVPDDCQPFVDCNNNAVQDSCDIFFGNSTDCDATGTLDECEALIDCNGNGEYDPCDVALGTSTDCNENGVLDECEFFDCPDEGSD